MTILILLGIGVITCVILAIVMDRPRKVQLEDERWARVVALAMHRGKASEVVPYDD